MKPSLIFVVAVLCGFTACFPSNARAEAPPPNEAALDRVSQWISTDDWDQIRKRRILRVLVAYSQSNFFIHKGVNRGFEYELLKEFPNYLQRRQKNMKGELSVLFVPVPFEQLLPLLQKGVGDVAAAGLTITAERQKDVSFTAPYMKNVEEVVVSSQKKKKKASRTPFTS